MLSRLRWFRLLIFSLFKSKKSYELNSPVITKFWISPFDVELFNASSYTYSTFEGLAYWNFIFHGFPIKRLVSQRITPLGFQGSMRFMRSMKLFQTVRLEMKPVYWDHKAITLQTKFIVNGRICAIGVEQVGIWSKDGRVNPQSAYPGLGEYQGDIPDIVKHLDKVCELSETL